MNKKEFETELHKIDSKLILTVLAHQGADEIVYYDGNQKLYKVFDFRNRQYCQKGSLLLSVNQFNKLTNLLLKAQAFIRGRNTFDDMSTVIDDSHNAKKLDKAMAEVQKAYKKTGYKGKKNDNPFKDYTDHLADVLQSKNVAYGDSFTESVDKFGLTVIPIRLSDKYNRVCELTKRGELKENDESLEDTLLDMAGYSILAIKYLKEQKND